MININEITANFFLVGCSIRHIDISNDLVFMNGNEKIQLEIGVKPVYQGVKNNKHSGTIKMRIDIYAERKDDPEQKASLCTTIEGVFSAPEEMEEGQFMQMVAINGAAALYSIARGKIEAITSNSFASGKIEIPFVNFLDYYKREQ